MNCPTCAGKGYVTNGKWFMQAPCPTCTTYSTTTNLVMTPATVQRVPNKPKTPMHSFRISDEDWEAAKAKAAERGENWSEELRKFARRYAKSKR